MPMGPFNPETREAFDRRAGGGVFADRVAVRVCNKRSTPETAMAVGAFSPVISDRLPSAGRGVFSNRIGT